MNAILGFMKDILKMKPQWVVFAHTMLAVNMIGPLFFWSAPEAIPLSHRRGIASFGVAPHHTPLGRSSRHRRVCVRSLYLYHERCWS